ncbi:hypothetical protein K469DRAFT_558119 [Zopfia rhizophila CBS 207.26]|uniref:B-related factor 1 n=1 Tax=Zopfia rhizophila CBS 207.26 TaxID=1314779 RepID=A0A6A6EN30_9PEZI|nr:hypothetical protein K469DRAFT_558119 [Zopfia rhizophila CBS 207.26]
MAGPAAPARPRRERLTSLKDRNFNAVPAKSTSPSAAPPKKPARKRGCGCATPQPGYDNGQRVCYNCGEVLEEGEIIAEVAFAENTAGATIVQGGFVGENQRYANTMGGRLQGMEGMGSREQTEWNGRDEIRKLAGALNLPQIVEDQAFGFYKLALNHNFVQGRRIRNVAAVSIYMACRRRAENTVLLMDLAEKIQVNVWALGDSYKELLKTLFMEDPATRNAHALIEIEPLMLKFCRKLEFDDDANKVAEDAVRILKRMNRDWMVQGRQPAGLCGACIILAARMNHYRRTVREVVYVVKVADATISSRLLEFKRTQSSTLTIDQFRQMGHKLKVKTLPPAIYKRVEKEERRKRKLAEFEGASNEEPEAEPSTTRNKRKTAKGQTASSKQKWSGQLRRDADGFLIPDPPLDETLVNADNEQHLELVGELGEGDELPPLPKKRGRPRKKHEPIPIPEEDLEIEHEIEAEINDVLNQRDWQEVFKSFKNDESHPIYTRTAARAQAISRELRSESIVDYGEEIGEDEFADDPDVMSCQLTPEEVMIKERIWVHENEDWMREQQQKMLQKSLEEASGGPKKKQKRRKHAQMGDGSVLEGTPAASPAEAVQKMLNKRAPGFSSHINYEKLQEMFPVSRELDQANQSGSPEGSGQGASPAFSGASRSRSAAGIPTPPATQNTRSSQFVVIENNDHEDDEEEEIIIEEGDSRNTVQPGYYEEEDDDDQEMEYGEEGYGDDYY